MIKQTIISRIIKIILSLLGFFLAGHLFLSLLKTIYILLFITPCMANFHGVKIVIGSILIIFFRSIIIFGLALPISYRLFKEAIS